MFCKLNSSNAKLMDSVIEGKRAEINRLRQSDHETPGWLLVALMRSPGFWLQDETRLNDLFRQLLESVTVDLGDTVAKSKLSSVSTCHGIETNHSR